MGTARTPHSTMMSSMHSETHRRDLSKLLIKCCRQTQNYAHLSCSMQHCKTYQGLAGATFLTLKKNCIFLLFCSVSRCQTVQLPLAKFELLSSDFVPSLISPQPKLVLKSAERGREQKQILISVLLMKGSGVNSKCLWKEAIAHQCKVMKSLFKDSIISNEFKQHCKWVVKRRKCLRPFDNS